MDLYHTKVSAITDNAVAGEVGPSEWNDLHIPYPDPTTTLLYEDDFIFEGNLAGGRGELGWTFSGSDTATSQTGVAGHPGILQLASGPTSGNTSAIVSGAANTTGILLQGDCAGFIWVIRFPSAALTNYNVWLGLFADSSAANIATTEAIGFKFVQSESAKWQGWTRTGSNEEEDIDTGADVALNTWYQVEARNAAGTWTMYVNGSSIGSASTYVPAGALQLAAVVKTSTGTTKLVDIDYAGIKIKTGTRY